MLKNYNVDTGDLNKRITIQKKGTAQKDEDGFPTNGWNDYKTVWSNVSGLYGKEFWSAKAINEEDTTIFTIRWQKALSDLKDNKTIYRIKYNNRIYNINFADNIQEADMYYKVKAKAVN